MSVSLILMMFRLHDRLWIMPQLLPFPSRMNSNLQVFCPSKKIVITSFESYLPDSNGVGKIFDTQPHLPARLCWLKENYDYYAYLPKNRLFNGHLLATLKHPKPKHVQKDGQRFVDDKTHELWQSLNKNLTNSINVAGSNMLVDLEDHEPRKAVYFGFTRGHKSEQYLCISLEMSRNAIVHRLAYLAYLVSIRYQWDRELVNQQWWKDLGARCGPTWVDSIWDTIYGQWEARDFVGVVVKPVSSSVRWLRSTLRFGVPIWVLLPGPGCYNKADGGFVMKTWELTGEQVARSRSAKMAKISNPQAEPTANPSLSDLPNDLSLEPPTDPTPESPANLPSEPLVPAKSISPPATILKDSRWYESWEEFFQRHEEDDGAHLEAASEADKTVWKSQAQNAQKFSHPGKSGPRVHVWESCESGGFF